MWQGLVQKLGWGPLLVLAAVAISALSQFYVAVGASGEPYNISTYVGHGQVAHGTAIINAKPAMTGWEAHPLAFILLPLLAAAFYFNWNFGVWWTRLRYVAAFVVLFYVSVPLERSPSPEDSGLCMTYSLLALLTAIVAGIVGWRSASSTPAVATAK